MGQNLTVRGRPKKTKPSHYLPAKKPRARPKTPMVNAEQVHAQLKTYLHLRRLMVERSLNPEVKQEGPKLDLYIEYLRTLEK